MATLLKVDFIITFFIVLVFVFLGYLVLSKNPKQNVNKFFALFTLFVSGFIIANYLENQPEIVGLNMLPWMLRLDFASSILASYFLFLFSINFQSTKQYLLVAWQKYSSLIFTLLIAAIAVFTDWMIHSISYYDNAIDFKIGPLFPLFFAFVIFCIGGAIVVLIIRYRKSTGIIRRSLAYVIFGLALSFSITVFVNMILQPLLHISADISRIGIYCFIFLISFTSYAIIRHRLMDIRTVVQKGFIYTIFVGIMISVYFLLALFFKNLFIIYPIFAHYVAAAIPILIIGVVLHPMLRFLDKITIPLFFQGSYNYSATAKKMIEIMNKESDVKRLDNSLQFLLKILKVETMIFWVFDSDQDKFIPQKALGIKKKLDLDFKKTSIFAKYLANITDLLMIEKLETDLAVADIDVAEKKALKNIIKKLNSWKTVMCKPIINQGKLTAVLCIGAKLEKKSFSDNDIRLIDLFAKQMKLIIENSMIYKQLILEKNKLQKKVKELQKFNELVIGRELKMIELKKMLKKQKINKNEIEI